MPIFDEIIRLVAEVSAVMSRLSHNTTLVRSVAQFSLTEGRVCGLNVLFCMRQFQCALSDIVSSISSISVDAW